VVIRIYLVGKCGSSIFVTTVIIIITIASDVDVDVTGQILRIYSRGMYSEHKYGNADEVSRKKEEKQKLNQRLKDIFAVQ
jgi:hypothetical protein